jgi:predicted nucleic-acid-binding Zn-ribbon protein
MDKGICPKCSASEVYRGLVSEGEGLTAGSYPLSIEMMTGKAQVTLWVETYICRSCGYLEFHVTNRSELEALSQADGWVKVPPTGLSGR